MVWTPAPAKPPGVLSRLYTGTGAFDIVGRRRLWYTLFGSLMLICIASMIFRGFNLGIDFVGGTRIQFPAANSAVATVPSDQVSTTVGKVVADAIGKPPVSVQKVGTGGAESVLIRTETLNAAESVKVKQALFDAFKPVGANGQPSPQAISDSAVSASWGGEITKQALIALAVFLVLVTIFLAFYFERSMAIAALVALVHDVVVTAGIYSIVGFEVTPSTVIGLLTILGFSLYDTVVVFDKVRENTRGLLGLTRRTYAEAANLALNQTLMRSINTSLIAVLPVIGLLVIGVGFLGVGTLADLALVQMVGIIAGAASSIFLATGVLVDLKMRDPQFIQQAARVRARRARAAAGKAEVEPEDVASPEPAADADAPADDPDLSDDDALAEELRREKALSAAAGVPARTGKTQQQPARRPPANRSGGRPSGKSSRPTGKKRR
ncbi:MAG: protein-export rane protein SecF [Pseudonocardia sp.]|jgi:preprotein translocase subunit SecF|nr:protein-export rane protein SecF [Pseudonocardia sp.]